MEPFLLEIHSSLAIQAFDWLQCLATSGEHRCFADL
jgi:hypothetical protein